MRRLPGGRQGADACHFGGVALEGREVTPDLVFGQGGPDQVLGAVFVDEHDEEVVLLLTQDHPGPQARPHERRQVLAVGCVPVRPAATAGVHGQGMLPARSFTAGKPRIIEVLPVGGVPRQPVISVASFR